MRYADIFNTHMILLHVWGESPVLVNLSIVICTHESICALHMKFLPSTSIHCNSDSFLFCRSEPRPVDQGNLPCSGQVQRPAVLRVASGTGKGSCAVGQLCDLDGCR